MEGATAGFEAAFDHALEKLRRRPGPLTIGFSGGLDSSILAWELRSRAETVLATLGAEGAPDLAAGASAAEQIGLPWTPLLVGPAEVRRCAERWSRELVGRSGPARDVGVATALLLERSPRNVVVVGQGADELFLGYAHFRGLDEAGLARRAREDLDRLLEDDWPRARRMAAGLGRELLAPFLDPAVLRAGNALPLAVRRPGPLTKEWLRRWARSRGLPEELADRPKRAMQYGSRIQRLLRVAAPPRNR